MERGWVDMEGGGEEKVEETRIWFTMILDVKMQPKYF
jgi:hypothetical protein